jgi:hypothetical protein
MHHQGPFSLPEFWRRVLLLISEAWTNSKKWSYLSTCVHKTPPVQQSCLIAFPHAVALVASLSAF